jgi:hypothetical protein
MFDTTLNLEIIFDGVTWRDGAGVARWRRMSVAGAARLARSERAAGRPVSMVAKGRLFGFGPVAEISWPTRRIVLTLE